MQNTNTEYGLKIWIQQGLSDGSKHVTKGQTKINKQNKQNSVSYGRIHLGDFKQETGRRRDL